MALKLNDKYLSSFIGKDEYKGIAPAVLVAEKAFSEKS